VGIVTKSTAAKAGPANPAANIANNKHDLLCMVKLFTPVPNSTFRPKFLPTALTKGSPEGFQVVKTAFPRR
jgi:hypothetical protein